MYGYGKTNIGIVRKNNEDSIFLSNDKIGDLPNLYIVADGMGGHSAGEVASINSIKYFLTYLRRNSLVEDDYLDFLISAVNYSNLKVLGKSLKNKAYEGMGTTFTACTIIENKLYIIHIGDSRLYLIRDGEIDQLTSDHSYVWELVKSGKITNKEAKKHRDRNVVLTALGTEETILVDGIVKNIKDNDIILICSDGLSDMVFDEDILKIINESDFESALDKLIEVSNINGGYDNISAILVSGEVAFN